jgi:hypothetical protein
MTETAPEIRGGFPDVRPVEDAPHELGQFVAAMHRLQDLTVSTLPDIALWAAAAEHVLNACALLDGHQVPDTEAVVMTPSWKYRIPVVQTDVTAQFIAEGTEIPQSDPVVENSSSNQRS